MSARFSPRRVLLAALPFAGAALILALLFRRIPPERILEALRGADPVLFFAALLPVSVLYVLLDGVLLAVVLRWFHPRESASGNRSRSGRWTTWFRSGTDAPPRPRWWARSDGASEARGTARPIRIRATGNARERSFLDLCQRGHLLLWAAGGAVVLGSAAPERVPVAAALGFAGLCLLVAFLRGRLRGAGLGPPRWRLLQSLRRAAPRHYAAVFALKAPLIVAAALGHHFALGAFGIRIPVGALLATLPIIFLAGALPIAVARIGTSQAAWIYFHAGAAALSPGGEAALLAYSLSAHLTFLLLNAALSAPFLPAAWRAIRGARRPLSRAAGTRSGAAADPLSVAS